MVVDWDLLNAFAVPGNKILLTKELIEKADGPEEVAGVLAHEMGHGIALHPETGIIRAVGLAAALELMMDRPALWPTWACSWLSSATRARPSREADETALPAARFRNIPARPARLLPPHAQGRRRLRQRQEARRERSERKGLKASVAGTRHAEHIRPRASASI